MGKKDSTLLDFCENKIKIIKYFTYFTQQTAVRNIFKAMKRLGEYLTLMAFQIWESVFTPSVYTHPDLRREPRALSFLGKHYTTEIKPPTPKGNLQNQLFELFTNTGVGKTSLLLMNGCPATWAVLKTSGFLPG